MNEQYIEYLHKTGKLPNRYYYQLTKRSAQESYNEQKKELLSRYVDSQREQQLLDDIIQEEVDKKLGDAV